MICKKRWGESEIRRKGVSCISRRDEKEAQEGERWWLTLLKEKRRGLNKERWGVKILAQRKSIFFVLVGGRRAQNVELGSSRAMRKTIFTLSRSLSLSFSNSLALCPFPSRFYPFEHQSHFWAIFLFISCRSSNLFCVVLMFLAVFDPLAICISVRASV